MKSPLSFSNPIDYPARGHISVRPVELFPPPPVPIASPGDNAAVTRAHEEEPMRAQDPAEPMPPRPGRLRRRLLTTVAVGLVGVAGLWLLPLSGTAGAASTKALPTGWTMTVTGPLGPADRDLL